MEGVSVITGDLYTYDEDYVVQGAEPVRIRRSFISRDGYFKGSQHLVAELICGGNYLTIFEHNGTVLTYHSRSERMFAPSIGDNFYGESKKALRYSAENFTKTSKGISNTATGKMSAQTNLRNQYIIFDPRKDEKGKSFTLYASDGTKRRFVNQEGQEKLKGIYIGYKYKLVSETLPNGHIVHYVWDHENRINRVFTTNGNQSKTFSDLTLPIYPRNRPSPTKLTYVGSDHRVLTYRAKTTEVKNLVVQCEVISPDLPNQYFDWDMKLREFKRRHKQEYTSVQIKRPHLKSLSLKQNRSIKIDYYDENESIRKGYSVKSLASPVGNDSTPITTHTFHYDKPNKNSYVIDAQGNKTCYFWNDDFRLVKIERYEGEQTFHSADTFLWENTLLRCKTFYDEKWQPIFSRTYSYDQEGNVEKESFYGNLSGNGPRLAIGPDGFPIGDEVEKHVKKSTFSKDGRNLVEKQEEPSGLCIVYTYRKDAQLPKTKSICDGTQAHIITTYEYDDDLILNRETVEDGVSKINRKITPCKAKPYIGMPDIVEEFDGNGKLLRKTALHYGKGALIEKKDIYDAKDTLRYSLEMSYDEKGRLVSETNALGQRAEYKYDDIGNRKYAKDFSGRLETFYEYDFSNRLIKKEEKGDDGIHRVYQYTYDTKHNLITETDPYGNVTTYVPDAFGHRKEIHPPPILDERGGKILTVATFKYDSAGNEIEKTDAAGNITKTSYNAYGKPILITHPNGATEEFSYYLDGNLKNYTDARGVVTSYVYDYLGRIVSKTTSEATEFFEYTGQYLTKRTDAEKNETTYTYDLAGRKIGENCAGELTTYTYDELGRPHTTRKGDLITVTEYDLLDRVIEERNESISGKVLRIVKYEYDSAGNRKAIIRSINGKNEREEFKYDSVNRVRERKDALSFVETYTYNTKVNEKTYTDAMGVQTIETYNAQNRISSVEKRKGEKRLAFEQKYYNELGKLAIQVNTVYGPEEEERKVQTRWEYNNRGLLKTLTEADGTISAKITRYDYTPRGELETVTKPDGVTLAYRYDDWSHVVALTSSDGTVNHTMEYNLLGHLRENGTLVRKTDPFGRILSETFPHGHCIVNTYDNSGRRNTIQIPTADCLIVYEYEPANLRTIYRKKLDGTVVYSHTYTSHDLSGNLLEQDLIQNAGTVQFTIDPLNRKLGIASPLFTQRVLEFDGVGNIRKMQTGSDVTEYTYDDLYQLTSESGLFALSYAYDSLHNRLRKDQEKYEINALNQVTSHLQYNKNGNPIQNGTTIYNYDALDRLIRIETSDFIQTYTYDCLHRCLSKTVHRNGAQETVYFVYDGQNEIGTFDESLNCIELRILGETPHAENGAAVAIELNGKVCVPIHDLQGNLALLQPAGEKPTLYRYSAFGENKIFGETISPWGFSSKRTDAQTGLVNFGRRFYLPTLGRWLTPDPAGFTDGINLYTYNSNAPLTHIDEYGLVSYEFGKGWKNTPWNSQYSYTSSTFSEYHPWNRSLVDARVIPSLNLRHNNSPHFYINGMSNSRRDSILGGGCLRRTLGEMANVMPIYSESFGFFKDLYTVWKSKRDNNYSSDAVRKLSREVRFNNLCMSALEDQRKLFVTGFSRGSAEIYHAVKNFSEEERNRLIITTCGPIMILPRNLGFLVTNMVSSGDWCSFFCNSGLRRHPERYDFADVRILDQKDGFSGFNRDHFFQSRTYQEGLANITTPQYRKYGGSP
ncbi:MAG TPA: RHS repeat-associated core domain-containing protein [Chlamydiales bacterium]|nr:RHS repeat-associated core domain-containing protein [Chlamydiales bacterium]